MSLQKKVEYYCSNRFKLTTPHRVTRHYVKIVEISPDRLKCLLKAAIETINDTARRLIAFNTLNVEQYFALYREGITLRNHCLPDYFTASIEETLNPNGESEIDNQLAFLESVNARNRSALNKVLRGEPVADIKLTLLEPIIGTQAKLTNRRNVAVFYTVSMIEAIKCERCQMAKEKDQMPKHKLHPECQIEADKARVRGRGMVKIDDIDCAIAVRSSGVVHEMVSEFYAVYAPAWVNDAIKIYQQNENYAGMPLDEFLRTMKSDGKQ